MLIEFTVGNFRSIKEPVTLSMVAAKVTSQDPQVDINNTFQVDDDLKLLTSAAIYGANASGKSNIVRALGFMRWFVVNSSRESQANEPINYNPFRLDVLFEKKPSFFEVVFTLDNIPYRYGFEITRDKVETEWLFYSPNVKESKLFIREGQDIRISRDFRGGKFTKELTRENSLFISVAAQFNSETAKNVLAWFEKVGIISGLKDTVYRRITAEMFLEDESDRARILDLILGSDVGITSISAENVDKDGVELPKDMPEEFKDFFLKQLKEEGKLMNFKSVHNKKCGDSAIETVKFDLGDESEGTQKLFFLSGPIIDTLKNGRVLVVDEIEVCMHTLLTKKLVLLFHSPLTNPNHAQLIFATHDTNLLSNKHFRRDQIWFVEKDENSASHLYSLVALKVRNDASFEHDYMQGRYGGVPVLGEMRSIFLNAKSKEDHES